MSSDASGGGGAIAILAIIFLFPPIMVIPLVLLIGMQSETGRCTPTPVSTTPSASIGPIPPDLTAAGFTGDQLENARIIASVAATRGLGPDGAIVGITAAIGESSLVNLTYGDFETSGVRNPDGTPTTSIGLFQQQDPWGPREVRMDPAGAAGLFFDRLEGVTGWEDMSVTRAIHTVQGNLDPQHYAAYEPEARTVYNTIAPFIGALPVTCAQGVSNGVVAVPLDPGFIMSDTFGPRAVPTAGASSWHPAYDLINPGNACGAPIYASAAGTITSAANSWLGITTDAGETIYYLHSPVSSYLVRVGDRVTPGQHIAAVGNEGPSTGCHLDIRIDKTGTTNPGIAALDGYNRYGEAGPYINPALYFAVYGLELCDSGCLGSYSPGIGA